MSEENKAIVRRFYEAFGAEDYETLNEILAPDIASYANGASVPKTRDEDIEGIRKWLAAFAESYYTIEDQLAEGDKVASRLTLHAIHSRGDYMGVPPQGKQIEISGITTIFRIKDGRIVECRVSNNSLGLIQQLGLIPPPQPAG